jgi:cyanophycin synthetase
MELWRLWVLRGPNAWAACPVLEAGVDLARWVELPRHQAAAAVGRIRAWLPALAPDLAMARVVEQVTLHLQNLAGNPVTFAETREGPRPGRYRVAVEYQEEPVGRACLQAALEVCRAACEGRPFAIDEEVARLRSLADDQRLGPSTQGVVDAARARGIPVAHFNPDDGRYLQLGHGSRQRRSLASETDDVSGIARSITTDKHLTKQLLREAGVPVPRGRPVSDAEDAWEAACDLGLPVAVKPQDCDLAVGVGLDLKTREQVIAAYQAAREKSASVLVERFAPGTEHRVLVVEDRVVAVARIEPPHVIGDGVSRIADLVAAVNRDPRRGDAYPSPLRRLKLDAVGLEVLASQGYTPESVPAAGVRVLLRRNPPYIKNGGSLSDLTDRIHPEVAACAVAAAQALQVPVAGLDVVAEDIGRPLEEQGGVVVEVNTGPGLWLHMAPWADTPRPVGEAIIATLFPPGGDGRIPIVAVTGGRARSAAGRRLAEWRDRLREGPRGVAEQPGGRRRPGGGRPRPAPRGPRLRPLRRGPGDRPADAGRNVRRGGRGRRRDTSGVGRRLRRGAAGAGADRQGRPERRRPAGGRPYPPIPEPDCLVFPGRPQPAPARPPRRGRRGRLPVRRWRRPGARAGREAAPPRRGPVRGGARGTAGTAGGAGRRRGPRAEW